MKKEKIVFLIIFYLIITFPVKMLGQFSLILGGGTSNVLHKGVLLNEKGENNNVFLPGFVGGFGYRLQPLKSNENISLSFEFLFSQKGYRQVFTDSTYTKRFNYLSVPVLFNYKINNELSIHAGPEFSKYMAPLFKSNNRTYSDYNIGLTAGGNFNFNEDWSVFLRSSVGLLPIVNYYKIDNLGNITPYSDLRNLSIMIGVNFYPF